MALGGVERPRRVVRARLIHRRGRVLGGRSVRAACGGNPSLTRLPLSVMVLKQVALAAAYRHRFQARRPSQMTSVSPPVPLQARNSTTFTHRPRTVKSR
jgi:hypothetical protein